MEIWNKLFGSWDQAMVQWGMHSDFLNMVPTLYDDNTYPVKKDLFRTFRHTPYEKLKLVMLFDKLSSSSNGIPLSNESTDLTAVIIKEYFSDPGVRSMKFDPTYRKWADQGVLMLNIALTGPEKHFIWKPWTEKFLISLSMEKKNLLYVLFGKKAQGFSNCIINGKILNMVDPGAEIYSGGKSGFLDSKPFSRINDELVNKIKW